MIFQGDKSPISYSNLGEQAVHLPQGLLLRHLFLSNVSPHETRTYLAMKDIFRALQQDDTDTGGEPYLTYLVKENESVEADISDN